MKNLSIVFIIILSTIIITSCKKKEKEEPAQPTPSTPSTPAHVNTMTATVNSQSWAMASNQFGPLCYLEKTGTEIGFGGQTASNSPYTILKVYLNCQTGTYSLTQSGNFRAVFIDGTTTFTSKTGTINITSFDTSKVKSPYIDKLKCTFSFKTDTINNQSFNVTNGVVDFEKP